MLLQVSSRNVGNLPDYPLRRADFRTHFRAASWVKPTKAESLGADSGPMCDDIAGMERRFLAEALVVLFAASACSRSPSASSFGSYCRELPAVGRAIDLHSDVYVDIKGKGTGAEARQLRQASVAVIDVASKAAEIAPADVRSAWQDVAAIYAWMARSLSRTRLPGKVLLRLENSPVEWSAAQYEAATVIDFDAKRRCGFDPCLRQGIDCIKSQEAVAS